MDSSALERTHGLSIFVVFARWNAECLTKRKEAAEISWERMRSETSSTRSTKQLVSVRRPFPQQTNPARRPLIYPFRNQPFCPAHVIHCVAASLRVDPFPKSQLYTETPNLLVAL